MLSFKEKRELTKTVNAKIEELNSGGLAFKQKRETTKALNDALAKLNAKIDVGATSETLQKLVAGEYDSLTPVRFLSMLEKAVNELSGDIEPVKDPAIKYIAKNAKEMDPITESAIRQVFEPAKDFFGMPQMTNPSGDAIRVKPLPGMEPTDPRQITIDIDHDFNEPQTFRNIVQTLENARSGDEVTLKINSPGGRTDSAQAVYVALLETQAKTKAKIINAASSGSIVAMACDEIITTPFCTMMIHNASSGAYGKVGDLAASATHYKEFFREWFEQLYAGFLTNEEIIDVVKGQEFYMKESQIKERLSNWKPIRARVKADGSVVEA